MVPCLACTDGFRVGMGTGWKSWSFCPPVESQRKNWISSERCQLKRYLAESTWMQQKDDKRSSHAIPCGCQMASYQPTYLLLCYLIVGQKSKCWYRVAHNMMMNGKTVILAGRSWPLAHMTYYEWRQKCLDDRLRLGEDKEVKGGEGGGRWGQHVDFHQDSVFKYLFYSCVLMF